MDHSFHISKDDRYLILGTIYKNEKKYSNVNVKIELFQLCDENKWKSINIIFEQSYLTNYQKIKVIISEDNKKCLFHLYDSKTILLNFKN